MSNVSRRLVVPDSVRIHRYQSLPEIAPSLLFFSGGSALNKIARVLKSYTHHSMHLVTPFDSGGSSAKLRQAFNIPAVGDLRSRIMALADETVLGQPDVFELFSYRLPYNASMSQLKMELAQLAAGTHRLMEPIMAPMKTLITTQLAQLKDRLPPDFDLRGASVGNLIIAGGYLSHQELLDPIVFLVSRLVKTLGQVATIIDETHHLGVRLTSGEVVLGQHLITGKEQSPLAEPIEHIWLNQGLQKYSPISAKLPEDRRQSIEQADLICFPPGSFFTSLIANLLVDGVSQAIINNPNPKIYLPNLGLDPEQLGWGLMSRVEYLLTLLLGDAEKNNETPVLNWLLIDEAYDYGEIDYRRLQGWGVNVVKTPLITNEPDMYSEHLVVEALLSFT
ncbi:GAK system CofD-like protein [Marinomonas ostreistagni]|uniref:GAK system CofD-like protein n=1 Tax=Marinomonas ostreistagni TaxID=359209 RepID=A0ABS0Z9U2_9GAMM|nr:GAK system CofD-like protein [Marinomonas ostreistagni]MBJ7550414.1 GAK system CofD-like protein [Marinomonas ostreistagni]